MPDGDFPCCAPRAEADPLEADPLEVDALEVDALEAPEVLLLVGLLLADMLAHPAAVAELFRRLEAVAEAVGVPDA